MIILPLFGLILVLIGFILNLRAMWLRRPGHPQIDGRHTSWNPIKSFKILRNYYEGNGYRCLIWGNITFLIGMTLNTIYWTLLAR
jgi:hypothetical protein